MTCRALCTIGFLFFAAIAARGAAAQEELPQLPPRAAPTATVGISNLPAVMPPELDPARATTAYLAEAPGAARARADAYFEGGTGLRLLNVLYALVAAGLLLGLRLSSRLRDFASERTHSRTSQAAITIALMTCAAGILAFPAALYETFFREHAFGFSSQSFIGWLRDYAIGFAVVLGGALIVLTPIYAVMRRARYTWWIWSAGIAILFGILVTVAWPAAVAPLFNHYAPLPESALKQDIVSLARANGVPADRIYSFDESRRSTRMSADVKGFLGTARISLSDNLLKNGTHDEVMAAAAREIGNYVLGHTTRLVLMDGLLVLIGFAFLDWSFTLLTDFLGGTWGVRRPEDPAGLPLLAALAIVYMLAMMPVTNTIQRTTESQADLFGINAARKPDAFATLTLKQGGKLDPARWEEIVSYERPSGRTRIYDAMRWKAGHMADLDILSGPRSPQ